jgi:hypothetical protein
MLSPTDLPRPLCRCLAGLLALLLPATAGTAADLQILLPLQRTAYQTNEQIDLSVVRQSAQALPAGDLVLNVGDDAGSKASFTFAVGAVPARDGQARRTEHLHLNGWLLRPGHYAVEVTADGATARTALDVYSHLRKSSFRLISWGRATGAEQLAEGEDSLGFNLFYGHYGNDDQANFIRAGMDFMSNCTMSGAHQMDLRMECDWSDPYVTRGGARRVVRRAFIDRTRPNVPGVHFYDEPGLTWHKHPRTGEDTPHGIPSQVRAYRDAFGHDPLAYYDVRPDNPEDAARWRQWARWKLGFMDAAWKEAKFGIDQVRPDYLSVTQSQYGWTAFTDGYYFNVVRSLPVNSGHGGYDDYGPGYFNPSYTLEMARARDFDKPEWYLPTWYGNTPSERFRLEQYLSFMTNVQGMMTPPDIDPFQPATKPAAEGVVESNKLMGRLGTIFTTLPVTRPPVALLYSMSQNIDTQTHDRKENYAHSNRHGKRLPFVYLAGKMLQQQFLAVVEEDVVDGTLAANHKAVILASIDVLDPKVITALEDFAAGGGLVLTSDCKVKIKGAIDLGATPDFPEAETVNKLLGDGKYPEAVKYMTVGKWLEGAAPLAKALKPHLDRAGIKPVFTCDQPGIVATRQGAGDIEYLFAVNATYDPAVGGMNAQKATAATIGLEADGRPVYDAVLGGPVPEFQASGGRQPPVGASLTGQFRFGPGQMRVFARTARPVGKVQALTPQVRRGYTKAEQPLAVEVGAVLLDDRNRVLASSAPLEVRLIDPLGHVRYDLYRATDQGTLKLTLPLAANDPGGEWKVSVRELLNNTEDTVGFRHTSPGQVGALAGATARAVGFGHDCEHVYRFFRTQHEVKIVVGTAAYHQKAAERIAEAVKLWDVRCQVVKAADVNRPRPLTEEEAATWVGLEPARAKPGKDNPISVAGFDVRGPVVLLGNAQDNPLIDFIQKQKFLPYQPDARSFPGPGRGMLAWQREAVGPGQESVTVIAYDADGMSEAVGTLAEWVAGMEPLTRLEPPQANHVTPATNTVTPKAAPVAWTATLPDRAVAMQVKKGRLEVLTWDGTLAEVDGAGKVVNRQVVDVAKLAGEMKAPPDAEALKSAQKHALAGRIVKTAVAQDGLTAVAYWGGTVQVLRGDTVQSVQVLPQDITGLAWLDGKLVAGLANGQVVALAVK